MKKYAFLTELLKKLSVRLEFRELRATHGLGGKCEKHAARLWSVI